MWKRKLFIMALLALLLNLSVFALDVPDLTGTGSITISSIPGGAVTMYRVGTPVVENGDYSYVYTEDFAEFQDDPQFALTQEHLDSDVLAGILWAYTLQNPEVKGEVYTIKDGSVTISDLAVGVYLIGQTDGQTAEGYAPINPFLVTVPVLDGGKWDYSVDANPKVEPVNPKPSTSPGPSVSPKPSTSPEPSASPQPSESPKPSASPEPSESPQPSESPAPSESPKPSESPAPSASPEPSENPKPSASPGPSAGPSPSDAPQPSTSPNPAASPKPSTPQGPVTELPDTGQTNWPVPVLAVSGLLLFMLGWGLRFAGRKSEHEK